MKINLLCGAVLAVVFSASAGAQSCGTAVTTWHPDAAGTPTLSGNTCDAGGETGLLSLCEGASDAAGKAYVAQINSAAAGSYTTISLTNSGFTGYMAVVSTAAAGACNGAGDTGHCTTNGDAVSPVQHTNVPDGSYYLIVSNSGVDTTASCGPFTLTANGTLPVTLQNFTVS
jgi:hypothetical protein